MKRVLSPHTHKSASEEKYPFGERSRKLLEVLRPKEGVQMIDSAGNLFHRTMLLTLFSTGIRRAEQCRLQVTDSDSPRRIVHLNQGKGGNDREVPLRKKLLETLRVYGRWMKPKPYLFPGLVHNRQADVPVTTEVPWAACPQAAKRGEVRPRHVATSR